MNEHGKSDIPVVPVKLPNKAMAAAIGAEVVEERGMAKGNTDSTTRPGHSAGPDVSNRLDRVREIARKDKDARFTALLHHVDFNRLWKAYWAIRPEAAPGVDGVTWEDYGQDLEGNLRSLLERVHSGAYRASPSRRVYIPKADGGKGRSASPRWRTRSSSGQSSRCSTPSTRRTFSASPMGSGPGAARIMRWMRSASESSGRR